MIEDDLVYLTDNKGGVLASYGGDATHEQQPMNS